MDTKEAIDAALAMSNVWHGHVIPRELKARCGGPGMCGRCSVENGLLQARAAQDVVRGGVDALIRQNEELWANLDSWNDQDWMKELIASIEAALSNVSAMSLARNKFGQKLKADLNENLAKLKLALEHSKAGNREYEAYRKTAIYSTQQVKNTPEAGEDEAVEIMFNAAAALGGKYRDQFRVAYRALVKSGIIKGECDGK